MLIEQRIQKALENVLDVNIYYRTAPATDDDYVVIFKVSHNPSHSMGGDSGFASSVIQVSTYSKSYATAKGIKEKVRKELQNKSDDNIQAVNYENEIDMYDDNTKQYHVAQDFQVFHVEGF